MASNESVYALIPAAQHVPEKPAMHKSGVSRKRQLHMCCSSCMPQSAVSYARHGQRTAYNEFSMHIVACSSLARRFPTSLNSELTHRRAMPPWACLTVLTHEIQAAR